MSITPFPHGISSFGVPLMGGAVIPSTTGTYYFVDSTTGNDTDMDGKSTDEPRATVFGSTGALSLCTANKGDIIICMPGHAENIAEATSVNKEGITLLSLGNGDNRATFNFITATTASLDIANDNITFDNLRFVAGVKACAIAIDVNAHYFTLTHSEFMMSPTANTLYFVIAVDVDAYDYATIEGCKFRAVSGGASNTGPTEGIRLDSCDDITIRNNQFYGNFGDSNGAGILGEGALGLNWFISGNIVRANTTCTTAISGMRLTQASTGYLAYNLLGNSADVDVGVTALDPGACFNHDNWGFNAVDEYGAKVPFKATST